jgi:UDP-N-acetylglucosamine/UDP-N-acetylgalactosamine diphosphorylase
MERYEKLLYDNGQGHIIKYLENANPDKKAELINQIEKIDFKQLNELFKSSNRKIEEAQEGVIIEHVPFIDKYKMDKSQYQDLEELGENIIRSGKYAAVTMAGGQGTRLGHDGPKGTFLLNVKPEPKYLFQIIAEGLERANKKYNVTIPWYIMTSTENNDRTVEFMKEHNYFGYSEKDIMFFKQGNLPILSEQGKLLIDECGNIKLAADGNGCIYKSMKIDGVIDDMKKRGIEWVFIGAVDNALLNMVDPILLGLTINDINEIGAKSVVKVNPHERVGVFCKKDSKPAVIEYTEIPEEMAEETDEDGELLFGESHIMCNLYSISAIEKIANQKLPYHTAHKKAAYINENGELIKPEKPNAYKYEAFIFDGFRYFDEISILRGRREEDFAPIKNAEGVDSPESATKLYNDYWEKNANGRM